MAKQIRTDPRTAAERWQARLAGSHDKIREGVNAVTTSPGELAANNKEKYLAGVQASVGKWEAGLRRMTLEDWRAAMLTKGLSRISSGATAAIPKMTEFLTEFFPHLQAGMAEVDRMPNASLEDSINRAAAMMRHNAQFRRR